MKKKDYKPKAENIKKLKIYLEKNDKLSKQQNNTK